MSDNSRKFLRAERRKYSLEEYDKQVENSATQINYNEYFIITNYFLRPLRLIRPPPLI